MRTLEVKEESGKPSGGYAALPATSPRPGSGDDDVVRGQSTASRMSTASYTSGLDILQFTAAIYYLDEIEGELSVDVMRLGSMEGRVSCDYETVDGSGKAGTSYQPTSGTVVLEDGVPRATFSIKAVLNDMWAPTMEFMIKLSNPDNCQLGVYLKLCRVKVLNDDPFPTTKFDKEKMQDGEIDSGFQLWWEFCRLNYTQPGMAWRTWFVLFVDQGKNLYMYFKLWFNVYLVDVVLNTHDDVDDRLLVPGNRPTTILVMGVIWILPSVLLHFWDVAQFFIGIKSKTVAFLQEGLFREYLNFSEQSRSEVLPSDMIVAVSADCADVAGSYCTAMGMVTGLVEIGILANFILHHNPGALWVMGVMPAITLTFSLCRLAKQMAVSSEAGEAEIKMMSLVNEVCQKYRLVADYMQRPYMNAMFSERTALLREKKRPEAIVLINNEYFPSFLGFFFVGVYIATSSMSVVSGGVSLGTYLATISVFKDVAGAFVGTYGNFVGLTRSFEPLGGLTELYNKRTDLMDSKAMARKNRAESKKERNRLLEEKKNNPNAPVVRFVTDLMKIRLVDVALQYNLEDDYILQNVTLSLNQGELVAVTGPHGAGRATMLRLLGKVVFPTSGDYLVPSHLRSVHVQKDPLLMRMTLWENLAFGLPKANTPSQKEWSRARKILELFKSPTLVTILDKQAQQAEDRETTVESVTKDDHHPDRWQDRLTSLDTAIVHLARAFVMNPEILVLQRPLSNFSTRRATNVLEDVFVNFVARKGVCLPEEGEGDRRPRTLFYVPESEEQAQAASVIWALEVQDESVSKITMNVRLERDKSGTKQVAVG